MDVAIKLIGKPFVEITNSERKSLESELNQFYSTFPMPGEETLMEVSDDDFFSNTDSETDSENESEAKNRLGLKRRMPMRIINDAGVAKIDINDTFQINPTELLTAYLKKMIKYIKYVTGMKIDMITAAIPSMYGVNQRREFKDCFKNACSCKKIRFLTRPVAALIVLDNQRDPISCLFEEELEASKNVKNIPKENVTPDIHKIVFDMTEGKWFKNLVWIKPLFQNIPYNYCEASFFEN